MNKLLFESMVIELISSFDVVPADEAQVDQPVWLTLAMKASYCPADGLRVIPPKLMLQPL